MLETSAGPKRTRLVYHPCRGKRRMENVGQATKSAHLSVLAYLPSLSSLCGRDKATQGARHGRVGQIKSKLATFKV